MKMSLESTKEMKEPGVSYDVFKLLLYLWHRDKADSNLSTHFVFIQEAQDV